MRASITSFVVMAVTFAAAAPAARAAEFMWNFANGNLVPAVQNNGSVVLDYFNGSQNRVSFGNTATDPNVPDPAGGPTSIVHALPFENDGRGGFAMDYTNVPGNGGGLYTNDYTIGYDLLIPSLNWTALFNTDPSHGNDADFYVAPDGSVGIGAIGYSAPGVIQPGTWYRVLFAHDRTNNHATYYINGTQVFDGPASPIDGRFSLYTSDNPGPDLLILGEGDDSGNYTNDIYLSSIYFADRALTGPEPALAVCLTLACLLIPIRRPRRARS
jgi:hypothetical protein